LIGEDKNTTIIDGDGRNLWSIVYINANDVNINGFTVQNTFLNDGTVGINIFYANNCVISDNTITANLSYGVSLRESRNSIVSENKISDITQCGILLDSQSERNMINGNYIEKCELDGIWLEKSSYKGFKEIPY